MTAEGSGRKEADPARQANNLSARRLIRFTRGGSTRDSSCFHT